MIAALYVIDGGPYFGLEGVDPWPESRDARLYPGPHPVVAHPPCSRWCQLASVNQARWGAKIGEDGGCFKAALAAVRKWGGVLEHPAHSLAWNEFDLPHPVRGAWTRSIFGGIHWPGWSTEVSQSAYGHRARKRTWLYFEGKNPPSLDWSEPPATAAIGHDSRAKGNRKARLSPLEAKESPVAFRDLLLSLASSSGDV